MSSILPNDLINSLKGNPDFDYKAFVSLHDKEEKTSSIRFNPLKSISIDDYNIEGKVPWCNDAYYLKERPKFTLDPLFHSGCYYSQEASSMFVDYAIRKLGLNSISGIKALDLCAAPGGKSTLINSALNTNSLLVSNELIKSRVNILTQNMVRWGRSNIVISNNDPSAFSRLPGFFDFMLVDAPCSGSGMFHKDHSAIGEWSLANVKLCSERQKRILAQSLATLKSGGYLFYSTCSYSKEENEDIVDWLIDEFNFESINLDVDKNWSITESLSDIHNAISYRFYPHLLNGEGFFFSVLKRKDDQESFSMKKVKSEKSNIPIHLALDWVDMSNHIGFMQNSYLHVFPDVFENDLFALKKSLYLKNAGIEVGEVKGKELIPSHDLALSNIVLDSIQSIDLSLDQAVNFLRKENISNDINVNNLRGWVLMKYKNINIGWIKAMPNRINNYYPKEIRIWNL